MCLLAASTWLARWRRTVRNEQICWVPHLNRGPPGQMLCCESAGCANGRITVVDALRSQVRRRIVHLPPEAKDVPKLMKALVTWLASSEKEGLPCPIRAGIAHYQFATVHPYYDGNGRTARLLTTLVLHLGGYDLTKGLVLAGGVLRPQAWRILRRPYCWPESLLLRPVGRSHHILGGILLRRCSRQL